MYHFLTKKYDFVSNAKLFYDTTAIIFCRQEVIFHGYPPGYAIFVVRRPAPQISILTLSQRYLSASFPPSAKQARQVHLPNILSSVCKVGPADSSAERKPLTQHLSL